MSTRASREEYNSFINGLISDANELSYPKDSAVDMLNLVIDDKGVLCRRKGLDEETGSVPYSAITSPSTQGTSVYLWEAVEGDPDQNIIVAYHNGTLYFYNATDTYTDNLISNWTYDIVGVITAGGPTSSISLGSTNFKISGTIGSGTFNAEIPQFSSGNGKLYIVHRYTDIIEVSYDSYNNIFTFKISKVRIRDFDGADLVSPFDAIDYKPYDADMTEAHWYNLGNQGWLDRWDEMKIIFDDRHKYPSNAESWFYGKYVDSTTGKQAFSADNFNRQEFGTARAPQGHFIYNRFTKAVEILTEPSALTSFNGGGPAPTEAALQISATADDVSKLSVGDLINIYSAQVSTVTYQTGAGCGAATNLEMEKYNKWRVTAVYAAAFDVAPLDIDYQRTDKPQKAATPVAANSTAAVTGFQLAGHGLSTGDRIRFISTGNVWSYDNGAGCGAPVLTGAPAGWLTVTKIDNDNFTVAHVKAGYVGWCDTSPAAEFERTIVPNITAWCNNPASNFQWRKWETVTDTDQLERPTCNAFFSSRHVCGGVRHEDYQSELYISKVMWDKNTDPGRCYQDADPTAEYTNTLVATDGVVLRIQNMNKLTALREFGSGFLAFATNGIWMVWGGASGGPFTADNWTVDKVSDVGVHSEKSIVELTEDEEHKYAFWSDQGVFQIEQGDQSAKPVVTSWTLDKIQTFYDDLTDQQRNTARGEYNKDTHRIIWFYDNGSAGVLNNALEFDIRKKSWYPHSFSTSYEILDVVKMPTYTTLKEQKLKVITADPSNFVAACDFSNENSYDWSTDSPVDAAGYLETGHYIGESGALEKQIKHVTMYFRRTETQYIDDGAGNPILNNQSSCKLRAYWDWTDHVNAGKWSTQWEVYRFVRPYVGGGIGASFDNGYPLTVTRNKIKGSGRSLRLRLDTTAGKRMECVGWTLNIEGRDKE